MAVSSSGGSMAPAEDGQVALAGDQTDPSDQGWLAGAVFAFALVVGAYYSFRFAGRWSEQDTGQIAVSIRAMVQDRTLYSPGFSYGNGYEFSALSTFLVALTGLDPSTLLQTLFPLISASLALIAWPLYRELLGSGRAATLATLLLFIQPEFLFVILRGSHERALRALLLVTLFLLVRSFKYADQTREYAVYVSLFYLTVAAIIATNTLFGSSFIMALTVALAGSWLGSYFGGGLAAASLVARRRLLYVPLVCAVLAFLFNVYIFPAAGFAIGQVPDVLDRLQRLFLTTGAEPARSLSGEVIAYDPYATLFQQWIDVRVYFLVSLGTWVLILGSAILWARNGLRWLAGAGEPPTLGQWLLWLLYGAFAIQGGMGVLTDRAGVFGGNLQYRSFPSFAMLATPIVAGFLVNWRPKRVQRTIAAGALGVFALLALVKATNEPAVSNVWTFYMPAETSAMDFVDKHLRENLYWSDFDERMRAVAQLNVRATANMIYPASDPSGARTFLVTDVVRLRAARFGRTLPPVSGELRIYDNGSAQVYRARARTPYQE